MSTPRHFAVAFLSLGPSALGADALLLRCSSAEVVDGIGWIGDDGVSGFSRHESLTVRRAGGIAAQQPVPAQLPEFSRLHARGP